MKKILLFPILFFQATILFAQLSFKTIQKDKDSNIVFASFSKAPTISHEELLKQIYNCNGCQFRGPGFYTKFYESKFQL